MHDKISLINNMNLPQAISQDKNCNDSPMRKTVSIPRPITAFAPNQNEYQDLSKISSLKESSHEPEPLPIKKPNNLTQTSNDQGLPQIIKSLDFLMASADIETASRVNINIFYQPTFQMGTDWLVTNQKLQSLNSVSSNGICDLQLQKPSNPNHMYKNYNGSLITKITIPETKTAHFTQHQSENFSPMIRNTSVEQYIKPIPNEEETPELKKRNKISKLCNCGGRFISLKRLQEDPLFIQQLGKVKLFWRGTNPSYPFCLRKRVLKYYNETDEVSVDDIIDLSKKTIINDVIPF